MENRGTGRTTRLADKAIQDLFTDGFCIVQDHYNEDRVYSRFLMDIILARLEAEHHICRDGLRIHILNEYFRITLINKHNEK